MLAAWCGSWELNLCPLEEQQVFLTTDPSLLRIHFHISRLSVPKSETVSLYVSLTLEETTKLFFSVVILNLILPLKVKTSHGFISMGAFGIAN